MDKHPANVDKHPANVVKLHLSGWGEQPTVRSQVGILNLAPGLDLLPTNTFFAERLRLFCPFC